MITNDSLLHQKMKEWYQDFHHHPELSMMEFETTRKIKKILQDHDISVQPIDSEVGVIARIMGESSGPEIVLRADIDALPIQEDSALPFKSSINAVSHMCGHDFHMASLLGAAIYLNERKKDLQGSVKLIFQPGEETTTGAKHLLQHHVISGNEEAIYGFHNAPFLPAGKIGMRSGPFFASSDTLHISVKGQKGHAALPHLTKDATVAASAIVMGLQTAVSRNVNPLSPAVVTIGSLHSGQGHNVISDFAEMWGTVRTFHKDTREALYGIIPRIVQDIASAYNTEVDLEILPQTSAVNNDEQLTRNLKNSISAFLSPEHVVEPEMIMAAEDFAVFQEKIPGCYFLVGTGDASKGIDRAWHDPKFRVNDSVLPLAASMYILAAKMHLQSWRIDKRGDGQ